MANQTFQNFSSPSEIPEFPNAGGCGMVDGLPYVRPTGSDPFPLLGGPTTSVRTVDPALALITAAVYATIQAAVDASFTGDVIQIVPGTYNETVTIPRVDSNNDPLSQLTLSGLFGGVFIVPTGNHASGLVCHADDVVLMNLSIASEDDAAGTFAAQITGARFRASDCIFTGGEGQILLGPGTVAQVNAGTHGTAEDAQFEDCEFCNGLDGVGLRSSDYGAVIHPQFRDCWFHDLPAGSEIYDDGPMPYADIVHGILLDTCLFDNAADGTPPTNYVTLAVTGNTGLITNCTFATPTNEADIIEIAAGIAYTANKTEAGITTGRPS